MPCNRRLIFVCYPDSDEPIGGVKQIYRQVEILHQSGKSAWVLHKEEGFRATWFKSQAPVINLESYLTMQPNAQTDLIVLPEGWLTTMPNYLAGIPKVIFNQNAFYSFGLDGICIPETIKLYKHPDIVGVVTVSEDNRALLIKGLGIPPERCHVVLNGIDTTLFYMPKKKAKNIIFLERKQADHARKVALMAQSREVFESYKFKELPQQNHVQIAMEMREALVFLSCGHPEGFGLPLAEALACGCLAVGYHGLGGRDFALPYMKSVEFGDLLEFINTLENSLVSFEQNPQAGLLLREQAALAIQAKYNLEAETKNCIKVWEELTLHCNQQDLTTNNRS